MTDHWQESGGGLRGSTFLRLGAYAYIGAAGLHVAARLTSPQLADPGQPVFMAALVVWDLTLVLLATGFLWTGIHPFMTRFGIVVGMYIYAQAAYLLLSLITRTPLPVPPGMVTLGRTFLLAVFAAAEARNIGRTAALLLGVPAGLQFIRVFGRGMDILPPLAQPGEAILSALFMVTTACGIYLAATAVRRHEQEWSLATASSRHARFAEFNNPQHQWNREKKGPDA